MKIHFFYCFELNYYDTPGLRHVRRFQLAKLPTASLIFFVGVKSMPARPLK